MRHLLTLVALLFLWASTTNAQPAVRDSLLKLLPAAKGDTAVRKLYWSIGKAIENTDPGGARTYYSKAGQLSKQLHDTNGIIKSLSTYAGTFMVESKLDSMLYYEQEALVLARQVKDSLQIGLALFNIGTVYRDQGEYEKAIDYCLQGRVIMEAKGNKRIEAQMNDALQVLYYDRTEFDKAIVFGKKAVQQQRALNNKTFLAESLINLSMSYFSTHQEEQMYGALKEALQIGVDIGDTRIEAYALSNLGGYFLKKEDFKQVRIYEQRCVDLANKAGNPAAAIIALRAIAVTYLQEGQYAEATRYARMDLAIAEQTKNKREEYSVYRVLSCIAYARHDMKGGFHYDDTSGTILEKMVKDVLSEKSANLEKKYETEKKENRIRELETEKKLQELSIRQKSVLNYILFGSAGFLLILSTLLYVNYRQKQRLQAQRITELETAQRLTATEAVLKGEEQERTRLAKDLHDGLGGMLSGIKYSFKTMQGNLIMTPENVQAFERSMDMLDSSIKEMRRVAHNMMPEALVKFGLDTAIRDFCHDISLSEALRVNYLSDGLDQAVIDQTTAITLYRIVQELVHNSMKHAGARTAIVQIVRTGSQLAVTVEDDGKGFDIRTLDQAGGIGWINIRNRVEFLKGHLNIQSEAGKGTSVHIEVPVTG